MKLQLRLLPNGILKKVCRPVQNPNNRHLALAGAMHYHMMKWGGIGLSAPQVGQDIRIITINTTSYGGGKKLTMINPEIINTEETVSFNEGCLSLPGKFLAIDRPDKIRVKYIDNTFTEQVQDFDGITSRTIQHEIDHLNGITMDVVYDSQSKETE